MKIDSKATYAMAYTAFIMLCGSPSHHYATAAATEDYDGIQTKAHLMGDIDSPSSTSTMANEPVGGSVLLSEKEEEEEGLSQNTNVINDSLLESNNHGRDGAVLFEANDASLRNVDSPTTTTRTHDVSKQVR